MLATPPPTESSLAAVRADPPLTDAEHAVLDALMEQRRRVAASTIEALAETNGLGSTEVGQALRALEAREPALARREVDEGLGIEFWQTTPSRRRPRRVTYAAPQASETCRRAVLVAL
jgi:hypothetical protein